MDLNSGTIPTMTRLAISEIERRIKSEKVFKAKDLESLLGKRSLIDHLVKSKLIEPLGSGYYARPRQEMFDSAILISQKYFPRAVISGAAALSLHGLIERRIELVEADIPKDTSQRSHLITFRRVANSRLFGITTTSHLGLPIRVYDLERSLIDGLLKGLDSRWMNEAIKAYVARGSVDLERIEELDQRCGTDLRRRVDAVILKSMYQGQTVAQSTGEARPEGPRLLEAAIIVYSRLGSSGLDFKIVADEAGVTLSEVAGYFRTKTNLKKSVIAALKAKILETGAKPLESVQYDRRWLNANIDAFLGMSDVDELGHKIQRWCLAEQNDLVANIMELCSELLRGVTQFTMSQVKGISYREAESRALLLIALLDQYANLRWYYIDLLDTQTPKKELIESYKQTLREQVDNMLLAPVRS